LVVVLGETGSLISWDHMAKRISKAPRRERVSVQSIRDDLKAEFGIKIPVGKQELKEMEARIELFFDVCRRPAARLFFAELIALSRPPA
jgi:hypothetical protein